MCLATVYLNNVEAKNRMMKDVALIEAEGNGFWLIDLFGERRFVSRKNPVAELHGWSVPDGGQVGTGLTMPEGPS